MNIFSKSFDAVVVIHRFLDSTVGCLISLASRKFSDVLPDLSSHGLPLVLLRYSVASKGVS